MGLRRWQDNDGSIQTSQVSEYDGLPQGMIFPTYYLNTMSLLGSVYCLLLFLVYMHTHARALITLIYARSVYKRLLSIILVYRVVTSLVRQLLTMTCNKEDRMHQQKCLVCSLGVQVQVRMHSIKLSYLPYLRATSDRR